MNFRLYKEEFCKQMPKDWELAPLSCLGAFSKGIGISKNQLVEKGLPCIRYGEIYTVHDFIIKEFYSFISREIASEAKKLRNGDILFAGSGETIDDIGKNVAFLGKEEAYAGGDIIVFTPIDKMDSMWLSYVLSSQFAIKQKRRLGQGQSVVHIYPNHLASIEIPRIPYQEQKRISEILSSWDEAIEKTEKLIEVKKKLKKGLMQQILTGKTRVKSYKQSELRKVKLGEVSKIIRGQGLSKEKLSKDGKNKCILYGELYTTYDEVIKEVKSKTNYDEGLPSVDGDVLIPSSTTTTGIDLANAVALNEKGVLLGGDINVLRMKGDFYDPIFLAHYLTHIKKHEIVRFAQGITIIHLYGKDLKSLKIELPTLDEQRNIASILVTIDKEAGFLFDKVSMLKQQKKGLMQKLLTGKIRVEV